MHPTDIATLNAATQVTAQLLREAGINLEVQAMGLVDADLAPGREEGAGGRRVAHLPHFLDRARSRETRSPISAFSGGGGNGEGVVSGGRPTPRSRRSGRHSPGRRIPRSRSSSRRRCSRRRWDTVTYIPIGQYLQFNAIRDNVTGFLPSAGNVLLEPQQELIRT